MTITYMPHLRTTEGLELHQSIAGFASSQFSIALVTTEEFGITLVGQSHRGMSNVSKAVNEVIKLSDAKLTGFSSKHIFCGHFNAATFAALTQSQEPAHLNIFQYTPETYLDRALTQWAAHKNKGLNPGADPLVPAIQFSGIYEETYTRDVTFPTVALLQEFETLYSRGFFAAEAKRLLHADAGVRLGQN